MLPTQRRTCSPPFVSPAQALCGEIAKLRKRLAVAQAALGLLLADEPRGNLPQFGDKHFVQRLRAEERRGEPLRDTKARAERLQFGGGGADDLAAGQ